MTYDKERFITEEMYNNKKRKAYYDSRGLKVDDHNPNYDTYNPHFMYYFVLKKLF
ncbi:hypothetical protein [Bacillus thuringiensis]|uniref:hypothetical protein n=1 Tax=Bacillus thuringiensis TaxID=1428 RepID=UPI001F5B4CFA|nr:hypothetical protein [Bacillus thuringiensis]